MLIIIHRVNTIEELKKIPVKYGVEIDIRSMGNRLILNHNPYEDGEDLEEYLKYFNHKFIIFNIKETGIENKVIELAIKFGIKDYFFLDVEYPFIYKSTRLKGFSKIAIRFSEAEPIELALAHRDLVDWVWVDTFTKLPLNKVSFTKLKNAGFKLCLVCPDQFGRVSDIKKYREFMKKNNIKIDAVMTELEDAEKWES